MDYLLERGCSKALQHLLGWETWNSLSKLRRLALIELIQSYSVLSMPSFYEGATPPTGQELEKLAKARLKEIEKKEIVAIISGDLDMFPDADILDNQFNPKIFERLVKRMHALILGLEKLSFKHADLEKRRVQILDALNKRQSIPADTADLYIIDKVVPGSMDDETKKQMLEWFGE